MSTFVNLHMHNHYSLLDGMGDAKTYAKLAKKFNQSALALTNHGNIDGCIKHQKACQDEGIKPIHGVEIYVQPDAEKKEKGQKNGHMVLLVRNQDGWNAVCRLLTKASIDGFYYRPRVSYQWIEDLSDKELDGLVIMTACIGSYMRVCAGGREFTRRLIDRGAHVFLEVQPWPSDDQKAWNYELAQLSQSWGAPLVLTNDTHYPNPEDAESHEVLLAIQSHKKWDDPKRFKFDFAGLHFAKESEMIERMKGHASLTDAEIKQAVQNTKVVADMCDYIIPKHDIALPPSPLDLNGNTTQIMIDTARANIAKRFPGEKWTKMHEDRLNEEIEVITAKGFERYFLILADFVSWCKKNNIPVGPGRGSAAGSLLVYLLEITDVNPLKHGLIFSRFLNPERNDWPDIDVDLSAFQREDAIKYLADTYGHNHIARISTYGEMKIRTVVRDVCSVFNIDRFETDKFAKSMPDAADRSGTTFEDACKLEECQEFVEKYPDIIRHARAIEGCLKSAGQHASAVVLDNEDLYNTGKCNIVVRNKTRAINWDMGDSEYMGLMKLDALGLRNLSVIGYAIELIEKNTGIKIDLLGMEFDDEKTYEMLSEGRTSGVFQLSGGACIGLAKEMGISNFDDISAVLAMARPGPLQSGLAQEYVDRKNGHPWKKHRVEAYNKITEFTHGVIIYQEQIMRMFTDLAGTTFATADKIRKIVAKKLSAEEFEPYRVMFLEGCLKNNTFTEEEVNAFWKQLLEFAQYSFNMSHTVAYGYISYWTGFLKRNYPAEYGAAYLTYGTEDQKNDVISDMCDYSDVKFATPKVGMSDSEKWFGKGNVLYVPFKEIKGVGPKKAIDCMTAAQFGKEDEAVGEGFLKKKKAKKPSALQTMLENIKAFDPDPLARPENISDYFTIDIPENQLPAEEIILSRNRTGLATINPTEEPVNRRERVEIAEPEPEIADERYFKRFSFCNQCPARCPDHIFFQPTRSTDRGNEWMLVADFEFPGEGGQRMSNPKYWVNPWSDGDRFASAHRTLAIKCATHLDVDNSVIKTCSNYLRQEIRQENPSYIVAVGDTACSMFTRMSAIEANGTYLDKDIDDVVTRVFFAVHPEEDENLYKIAWKKIIEACKRNQRVNLQ